jgi:predicted nucleic acid-binding protein
MRARRYVSSSSDTVNSSCHHSAPGREPVNRCTDRPQLATRPDPLPHDIATGLIATWMRFRVQEVTLSILTGALEIKAAHGSSCSDSAIIAAARALGCRELYTEDMTHGREVEGSPS